MKIAIDTSYIQTKSAGYGHHTNELVNTLLKYGNEHSYTLFGWSYSLDFERIYRIKQPNVKIKVAKIPGFIKRFYWNTLRFPNISRFIGDFDIFHSIEPLLPPVGNKKKIITVHDLAFKKFPQFFESNVLSWEKYIVKNILLADAIIVQSQQTKSDLIEIYKANEEKIHIIHLPINSIFLEKKEKNLESLIRNTYNLNKPFILFVGTVEPRKNIIKLIKAFEYINESQNLDVDLVIVGKKGWKCKEIFRTINDSSEAHKIRYLNYVPEEHLAEIYRLALMFVYPSIYEGYGVPVLEAMASGTPVITSNTSSLKEIAAGVSILVDPNNVKELAEAIFKLYENKNLRDEFSTKGLRRVKQFDDRTVAEKLLNIYKLLI